MASSGRIETVLGPICPSSTGVTLTHEHLSMVFEVAQVPAIEAEAHLRDCAITLENLGWIRQNPYSHRKNLILNDSEAHKAVEEDLLEYKKHGGSVLVENTTHGLQRDLGFLKQMAEATGIKIVAGTGYYIAAAQPTSRLTDKIEELANVMRKEMVDGIDGIKCGLIGELGCSWPLHAFEKSNLTAAAAVQEELRAPVMIHPGRHPQAPTETLRFFLEAGGKASKTVMAHLDRTIFDESALADFANSGGSYCEFDLFGTEVSDYQLNKSIDMLNDAQRIAKIRWLVEQGFEDKIVISHDIHTKHKLKKFGGHGFSHIPRYILPKMIARGIPFAVVDKISTHNPREWLTME